MRQVRLGQTQGEQVQVLSGLLPDDEIAVDPHSAAAVSHAETREPASQ